MIREVPPNSTVVGIPAKAASKKEGKQEEKVDLNHHVLPDPDAKALQCLLGKVMELENEISKLKKGSLSYTDKT